MTSLESAEQIGGETKCMKQFV